MFSNLSSFAHSIPPWAILGLGALMGSVRAVWDFIYSHTIGYLVNKVSLTLTVEDTEHREAYAWLSQWLEANLRTRGVNSLLLRRHESDENVPGEKPEHAYSLIPYYGTYYMRWGGLPMIVNHWKEEGDKSMSMMRKMHTINFQVWCTRKRQLLLDLLTEAREQYLASQPKAVMFFRWSQYQHEFVSVNVEPRSLESVYMPEGLLHDILGDVRFFLESRQMYRDLGTPYRRGHLFEGPPGTGKTTLILAIASHLDLPVYSISLNQPEMSGDKLNLLLNSCAKPSIILMEDADCLAVTTTRDSEKDDGLTLADVLNALDGLGASENRLICMTTNHPDKLDPALVRSGRIDRHFHIGYAEDREIRRFYDRVGALRKLPPFEAFRASLPAQTTIADAQALAFQGSLRVKEDYAVSAD